MLDETEAPKVATKPVTVYGLRSSEDRVLRYVGQTTQSLARRLDSHIHCPKNARRRYVSRWINSVRRRGFEVQIFTMFAGATWHQTEKELIGLLRAEGARLVNTTPGGEGNFGPRSPEFRRKLSEARKGMKFSAEHCASMSRVRIGRPLPPTTGAKVSAALRGRIPKNMAVLHAAIRGKPKSPGHRAKLSAALKGRNVRMEASNGLAH